MSAHRHQSTWRSITFNRVYKDAGLLPDDPANLDPTYANSDYRLERFDPTSVQVVDFRELRQHLEGADPNQSFEGVRMLVGSGTILGSSHADLEDKTWAMYEAFSPAACRVAFDALDPRGVGPFSFKRDAVAGTKALRFYAKPAAGRPVIVGRMREGLSRPFHFQLVATDPFAYDEALTQTTIATPAGGAVTNPGNIYTRPKIVITMSGAGAANFSLANSTLGQSLAVDLSSFVAADVITIDVARSTIVLGAATDRLSKLVSGFITNMTLAPGANTIAGTNVTGIASIRFDFRGAYA